MGDSHRELRVWPRNCAKPGLKKQSKITEEENEKEWGQKLRGRERHESLKDQ